RRSEHPARTGHEGTPKRRRGTSSFLCLLVPFCGRSGLIQTLPASPHPGTAMPLAVRLLPVALLLVAPAAAGAADPVDFARDVRPVLSNTCFKCHGPDVQKGKLRLDSREAA